MRGLRRLPGADRPWIRSYTFRTHDPSAATLDVDFLLHAGGEGDRAGDALGAPGSARGRPGDVAGGRWPRGASRS
ncbi:siderophore-interacting protein [Streptomyces sp. NPDC058745]|uniref:siderophore-interacting protein n=1 Tax=Streptomyces sp. NPDC058745 TaxID=3346621 RepID=UPI00367BD665